MIATINLPGSRYFRHFHGTKAECEKWLEKRKKEHQKDHGGLWTSTYLPAQIHSEKKVRTWKWLDGSKICKHLS